MGQVLHDKLYKQTNKHVFALQNNAYPQTWRMKKIKLSISSVSLDYTLYIITRLMNICTKHVFMYAVSNVALFLFCLCTFILCHLMCIVCFCIFTFILINCYNLYTYTLLYFTVEWIYQTVR